MQHKQGTKQRVWLKVVRYPQVNKSYTLLTITLSNFHFKKIVQMKRYLLSLMKSTNSFAKSSYPRIMSLVYQMLRMKEMMLS